MSVGEFIVRTVVGLAQLIWFVITTQTTVGQYIFDPVIEFLFDKFHIVISFILSMLYMFLYFTWISLIWVILDYLL